MDLKEVDSLGGNPSDHWYYIAKSRAIMDMLGERQIGDLLDVGAGSGVFSQLLIENGCAGRAVCVDPNYREDWVGNRASDRISYVRGVDEVAADTVLMLDVIEHVDDDIGLIADYAARAKPGTRFMISAPAFKFLWSSHDEALDHRRRYDLAGLRDVAGRAGLEIADSRYFFGMLFPAVAALRLAGNVMKGENQALSSHLKAAPDWLNKTLVALHDFERAALFPVNRFAGVSAFCLAVKPAAVAARSAAA